MRSIALFFVTMKVLNSYVLLKKISEGVEVRLLYDDVGSIGFVNDNFAKRLEEKGIRCRSFNKVSPAFRLYMNNRDHRKIAVIDGKVEYASIEERR